MLPTDVSSHYYAPRKRFLLGAPVVGLEGAPVGSRVDADPTWPATTSSGEEFGLLVEPEEAELLIRR